MVQFIRRVVVGFLFFSSFGVGAIQVIQEGSSVSQAVVPLMSVHASYHSRPWGKFDSALALRLFTPLWQRMGRDIIFLHTGVSVHDSGNHGAFLGTGYRHRFGRNLLVGSYAYLRARYTTYRDFAAKFATKLTTAFASTVLGEGIWYRRFYVGSRVQLPLWKVFYTTVQKGKGTLAFLHGDGEGGVWDVYLHDYNSKAYGYFRQFYMASGEVGYDFGSGFSGFGGGYVAWDPEAQFDQHDVYPGVKLDLSVDFRQFLGLHGVWLGSLSVGYRYDFVQRSSLTLSLSFGARFSEVEYASAIARRMGEEPRIPPALEVLGAVGRSTVYHDERPVKKHGRIVQLRRVNGPSDLDNMQQDNIYAFVKDFHLSNPLDVPEGASVCGKYCAVTVGDKTYSIPSLVPKDVKKVTVTFAGDGIRLGKDTSVYYLDIKTPNGANKAVSYDKGGDMGDIYVVGFESTGRMYFKADAGKLTLTSLTFDTGAADKSVLVGKEDPTSHFSTQMAGDLTLMSPGGKLEYHISGISTKSKKRHDLSGVILDGGVIKSFTVSSLDIDHQNGADVCGVCLKADAQKKGKDDSSVYVQVFDETIKSSGGAVHGVWLGGGTYDNVYLTTSEINGKDPTKTLGLRNEGTVKNGAIRTMTTNGTGFTNEKTGKVTSFSVGDLRGLGKDGKALNGIMNHGTIYYDKDAKVAGMQVTSVLHVTETGFFNDGTLTSGTDKDTEAVVLQGDLEAKHLVNDHGKPESKDVRVVKDS